MQSGTSNAPHSLGEFSIQKMIKTLQDECQLDQHLPGGGYLHMSDILPYLVVYRVPPIDDEEEDLATVRFVLSEASFLIVGNKEKEAYQDLIYCLGEAMASKFKAFLILELYAGEFGGNKFIIKGPVDKLPATLKVFKKELDLLGRAYQVLDLEPAVLDDTPERHPPNQRPLLPMSDLKEAGCLLISLEIPPVYRNREGNEYPVFFRSFKDDIVVALHKTIYEFIRVQTSSGVKSYRALGRRSLQDKLIEIDRALAAIETSYQFLWLISPANIRQIKDTFFESKFEKVLTYHYRLLPVDPDVLKRKLFKLRMEEIDDPALSFIFREKREELDLQISMLTDRGSKKFFYNSMMLFGDIEKGLLKEAETLLREVEETGPSVSENIMKAEDFRILAQAEFEYFQEQDPEFSTKIHVREDVNILMVSQGELYIPADYKLNTEETTALIQHEVGTHVLTYYNGKNQPLNLLSVGLTDYDTLQEGLAVLSEYLVGGLTGNRMRTLAGRVIAASARMHGGEFQDIFHLLHEDYGFSPPRSFNITSRILQGGGFTKDISYLKGLLQVKEYLEEGGDLVPLLTGKFALDHLPKVTELTERGVLNPIRLLPRYLYTLETKKRLEKIRKGIPLSQMINS